MSLPVSARLGYDARRQFRDARPAGFPRPPAIRTAVFLVFWGGSMAKLDEHVSARTDGKAPHANGAALLGDALARAFNDLRDELISTLVYVLGNRDDALDAAQDVFIKCWGAREQLPQIQNLRAWI